MRKKTHTYSDNYGGYGTRLPAVGALLCCVPATDSAGCDAGDTQEENWRSSMFVLKNAGAALKRHKWYGVFTALIALFVSFGSTVGLAVIHEDDVANNDDYQSQTATAQIRLNAATQAKRDGADDSYTDNYLTWTEYSTYATAVQSAGLTFDYTLTESIPVRQSDSITAIKASGNEDADKTGGELTLQSFYTLQGAQDNNPYGDYKVVDGKHLKYSGGQDNGVLISRALADANDVKVGDTITIGHPTDTSKTYDMTVRGIYEYVGDAPKGYGDDAEYAKDNRNNVIYTSYYTFASNSLDDIEATGWAKPDLNIVFSMSSPADYDAFVSTVKKAKLDSKYDITSPSLTAYKESIAPLNQAAATTRIAMIALCAIGGIAAIALTLYHTIKGRTNEIATALVCGVTKGRLGGQFMLETLMCTLPAAAIGLLAGALTAKSIGMAVTGHETAAVSASIWPIVWGGLAACLVIGIIAALRAAFYPTPNLFMPYAASKKDEA